MRQVGPSDESENANTPVPAVFGGLRAAGLAANWAARYSCSSRPCNLHSRLDKLIANWKNEFRHGILFFW